MIAFPDGDETPVMRALGARDVVDNRPVNAGPFPPPMCAHLGDATWDRGHRACYVLAASVLSGDAIVGAQASLNPAGDQQGWGVDITYRGNTFVDAVAKPYVNKQVAIVVDGAVLSAPVINPGITGGDVRLSGGLTEDEARALAAGLAGGPLPVVLQPVS